jgi:DNA-directed RNA polymerase specialized sigma24 family protein
VDLTNYQDIAAFIRKLCKHMTPDDQDDFIQEVYVKLLQSKLSYASRQVLRNIVKRTKIDLARKADRRPKIVYDNDLVEGYSDDSK